MANDDAVTQAEEAYQKARAACRAVQLDLDATETQKEKAKAARDAMWAAYSEAILDDFASRTALLRKLIGLLEGVIGEMRGSPVGNLLEQMGQTVTVIEGLLGGGDSTNQG